MSQLGSLINFPLQQKTGGGGGEGVLYPVLGQRLITNSDQAVSVVRYLSKRNSQNRSEYGALLLILQCPGVDGDHF